MGRTMVMALALALICSAGCAQPPDIPAPEGAVLVSEVNMSDADIFGVIKQAIPAFTQGAAGASGELGILLANLDLNMLTEAIHGVERVRAVGFALPEGADPMAVLALYEREFSAVSGWSRIIYDVASLPKNAGAVYTRAGQEFVCIGLEPAKRRLFIVRTAGFVDVPKLATWIGRTLAFVTQMDAQKKTAAK